MINKEMDNNMVLDNWYYEEVKWLSRIDDKKTWMVVLGRMARKCSGEERSNECKKQTMREPWRRAFQAEGVAGVKHL